MTAICKVSITTTGKENHFQIQWHSEETNALQAFESNSELTAEETERMWQWPHCQLSIGEKLFRLLDGRIICPASKINTYNCFLYNCFLVAWGGNLDNFRLILYPEGKNEIQRK